MGQSKSSQSLHRESQTSKGAAQVPSPLLLRFSGHFINVTDQTSSHACKVGMKGVILFNRSRSGILPGHAVWPY